MDRLVMELIKAGSQQQLTSRQPLQSSSSSLQGGPSHASEEDGENHLEALIDDTEQRLLTPSSFPGRTNQTKPENPQTFLCFSPPG